MIESSQSSSRPVRSVFYVPLELVPDCGFTIFLAIVSTLSCFVVALCCVAARGQIPGACRISNTDDG